MLIQKDRIILQSTPSSNYNNESEGLIFTSSNCYHILKNTKRETSNYKEFLGDEKNLFKYKSSFKIYKKYSIKKGLDVLNDYGEKFKFNSLELTYMANFKVKDKEQGIILEIDEERHQRVASFLLKLQLDNELKLTGESIKKYKI